MNRGNVLLFPYRLLLGCALFSTTMMNELALTKPSYYYIYEFMTQ